MTSSFHVGMIKLQKMHQLIRSLVSVKDTIASIYTHFDTKDYMLKFHVSYLI